MRRLKVEIESWPIAGSVHDFAGQPDRGARRGRGHRGRRASRARRVRSLCALWRNRGGRGGPVEAGEAILAGAARADLLDAFAARARRATRSIARCGIWRRSVAGKRVWTTGGPARAAARYHRLHAEPRRAGSDGGGGARGTPPAAAQGEARRRRRLERIAAVRRGAPDATLIVDANEGWNEAQSPRQFRRLPRGGRRADRAAAARRADDALAVSAAVAARHAGLRGRKLHTAADLAASCAQVTRPSTSSSTRPAASPRRCGSSGRPRREGFRIMVGCMVGTSLAMAPALLLAAGADFVDLDGPLLLARDREPGLTFDGSVIHPPAAALWG